MSPVYQMTDVRVNAKGKEILHVPELAFRLGEFVAVAGPNGAGKSTLLSVLSGLRKHFTGECFFYGRNIRTWSRKDFSKKVAVVHQGRPVSFPFTVDEVVLMGRTPHMHSWFETGEDLELIEKALEQAGASELRGREFRTLSGGEQQRVILASALAQQPKVLLLDEPTSFLDLHHQVHFYKLLAQLRDAGVLVISVTHDLNLAASYADRLLLLHNGRPVAEGTPQQVITAELMSEVFRVAPEFWKDGAGKIWMRYDG